MSFGNDFDAWRRKRQRPGAVLADGSTSVLAQNDLLGSTVDPDEFTSWRRVRDVGDEASAAFLNNRKKSIYSGYDSPEDGLAGLWDTTLEYATRRSLMPGGGIPQSLDPARYDPIAGFFDDVLTPAGTATMVSGYGLGKGAVNAGGKVLGPLLRGAERTGSAIYAGRGVDTMLNAESEGELGLGAVEAFLGYLGARQPGPGKATVGDEKKLLGAGDPTTDPDYFEAVPGNDGNPWARGPLPDNRSLPSPADAEPFGSWGRTRQMPADTPQTVDADGFDVVGRGNRVDGMADPLALLEDAGDPRALYPASLPPHGPIPLGRPPTALERPDLLTDGSLLQHLRTSMQTGNVDHWRVYVGELENRRGRLSSDPLAAPVPPASASARPGVAVPTGAPETGGRARRGQASRAPQITPEMSDAEALEAFLAPHQARMGATSTRTMPQPIDVPLEQRPIRARTAPAPEFEPIMAQEPDPLDAVAELVGVGALTPAEEAAERAYQTVLAREVRQEPLRPGGSLSVMGEMDKVRDAREAARAAVDVEVGNGTSRTAGRASEGPGAGSGHSQYPHAADGGLDVSGGVPDRAVGGPDRPAAPTLKPADEARVQRLAAEARAAGHQVDDADLQRIREHVESARAYGDEQRAIDLDAGDRGLLQFIASRGGLSVKAETGMLGELEALAENLDGSVVGKGLNKDGSMAKSRRLPSVHVPGIDGPIVTRRLVKTGADTAPEGLAIDEMVTQLRAAGFNVSMEDVTDVVARAARKVAEAGDGPDVESVLAGAFGYRPGARWWDGAPPRDEFDDVLDLLDTGEAQPRLPGAEGVRAQEIATPQVAEAPFALERQVSRAPQPKQTAIDTPRSPEVEAMMTPEFREQLHREIAEGQALHDIEWSQPGKLEEYQANLAAREAAAAKRIAEHDAKHPDDEHLKAVRAMEDLLDVPADQRIQYITRDPGFGGGTVIDGEVIRPQLPPAQTDVPRGTSRLDAMPDALDEAVEAVAPTTFEALPGNVRSYLTKRLGWTPEEINALSVDEATAHGRNQVRPDRPEPSPESRKQAEGRMAVRKQGAETAENELLEELERFFEIEQPKRRAVATERRAAADARYTTVDTPEGGKAVVQRPGPDRKLAFGKRFPSTEKLVGKQIEVTNEASQAAEDAARFKSLPQGEQKAHQSRLAGQHRQIDREIERAWADPNPSPERIDKLAKLYEEQADEFMKGQLRGGTGKELSNDELAKKFTTLYGGIPGADPEMIKALVSSLRTSPAMRAFVGGMAGYAADDEDGFRGALYGMALAAAVPSGAQALARAYRKVQAGQKPWPIFKGPSADKDISFLRKYLPFAPERTVPEVFNQVQKDIANMQSLWETSYTGDIGHLTRLSEKRMAGEIRAAAAAAKEAKQPRKAWYLEKMANGMEGKPTLGQRAVKKAGKEFGVKLKGNEVERHVAGNIYRVLIGWALDSAAKNTTQPMLATLYVSPKSLTKAYQVSRDPRALKLAERFDLNIHNIPELADTGIVGRGGAKAKSVVGKIEDAASAPIRLTDNFNRRVVMLAALEQAGKLDDALAGKLSIKDAAVQKAMSIVRKTQGHTGAMGSHPLYRGPVMGSIKPFTKFPFLFIDNAIAAFQDPEAKGAQFAATIMGAALVAKMFGIDFEDLFVSGGRPLGLDLTHPAKTVRDLASGRTLPATRALVDAKAHLTGDADHSALDDAATLVMSRYPRKAYNNLSHLVTQGMGEHRTAAGTGVEHDGLDDALGLLGLRTEERGDKMRAREEQYEWLDRTRRRASSESRTRREAWRDAYEDGDEDALAEIEALMSPQQRRQLRREAEQTPDERMRSRVPVSKRPEFDQRFRNE